MRRNLAQVAQAFAGLVAYGGISLAKVIDLRILRNEIIANGNSHLQPICGVLRSSCRGFNSTTIASLVTVRGHRSLREVPTGIRGGVHIWIILPVIEQSSSFSPHMPSSGHRYGTAYRVARCATTSSCADGSRGNVSRAWADGCAIASCLRVRAARGLI